MEGTGSFVCSSGARVLLATPSHAGSFVVLLRSYGLARWKRSWAHNLLDKQMHQTMLQMCAAPICAAHHASRVQILASVPGSCMWHA